jgi:hypothetical protein
MRLKLVDKLTALKEPGSTLAPEALAFAWIAAAPAITLI